MEQINFFKSYYRAAQMLEEANRLAFYDAIFGYAFDGDYPDPKSEIMFAFTLVEPTITRSLEKSRAAREGAKKATEKASKKA